MNTRNYLIIRGTYPALPIAMFPLSSLVSTLLLTEKMINKETGMCASEHTHTHRVGRAFKNVMFNDTGFLPQFSLLISDT